MYLKISIKNIRNYKKLLRCHKVKKIILLFFVYFLFSTYGVSADVITDLSDPVTGGAIDMIPPSPFNSFTAVDNVGAGTGILLTWDVPEDHGIVGYITAVGLGEHPIYGVNEYQIFRREKGAETFEMIAIAQPLSTSYIDDVPDGPTIYEYYVKASDGNPDNSVDSETCLAMATANDDNTFSSSIIGTVTDEITGELINNANITLSPDGYTATTSDDGMYSIIGIPPGLYTITVKKNGYKEYSAENILLESFETQTVDIALASESSITITGNVLLENQTNHSSIEINFARLAPSEFSMSTATDSNGDFSINILSGIYTISYTKEGYQSHYVGECSLYSDTILANVILLEKTTILHVPDVFSSIQSAINSSSDSDTVLVAPGTYYENINFNGKNITVASHYLTTQDTTYISQTVIDGNRDGRVVEISSGEDSTTVLCGFTITNGYVTGGSPNNSGAGIYCDNSNPRLSNIIVTINETSGNYGYGFGAGIYLRGSNILLTNSTIRENTAVYGLGGGIYVRGGSDICLINVNIIQNTSYNHGGGIYCSGGKFININVCDNISLNEDGAGIYNTGSPVFKNCIVSDNIGLYGFYNEDYGQPSISYSNFWNNDNGNFYNCGDWIGKNVTTNANGDSCDAYYNIQLDPLFVDFENDDFHLKAKSPCIGAGTSEDAPSTDIEGFLRGTSPDIGAYENALDEPGIAPVITTTSLSDAYEDSLYSFSVIVEDQNTDETHVFKILTAPEWIND